MQLLCDWAGPQSVTHRATPRPHLLLPKLEELEGCGADRVPVGLAHQALRHNLLGGDGHVVVLGLREERCERKEVEHGR